MSGPVQDLLFLQSGLLLSCSNGSKEVFAWIYQQQKIFDKITLKEEIRCMDYVAESAMLLVGTENNSIVTQPILEMVNYFDDGAFDGLGLAGMDMEGFDTDDEG
jgi:hypothetical protein